MARRCFDDNGWSEDEMKRLTGKSNSDDISAEDLQEAIKNSVAKRTQANQQAAAVNKAVLAMQKSTTPARGVHGLLSRDWTETVNFLSADQRINAIRSTAKSHISDAMEKMSPLVRQSIAGIATGKRKLTPEQQSLVTNTIKEIFGETSANADAQKFAKGWKAANDKLIDRYGRAGGDIRTREDWRLPQAHDKAKIRAAGSNAWVEGIKDLLDVEKMRKRMRSASTTDADFAMDFDAALSSAFRNITTGHIDATPPAVKDMLKQERFLLFKDAESWLEYQNLYGDPNIYAAMLGNIDSLARNIGLMETFGPDPHMGFQSVLKASKKQHEANSVLQALDGGSKPRGIGNAFYRAQATYDLLANLNTIDGYDLGGFNAGAASALTNIRNVRVASKLGGAVITAMSDVVFSAQTSYYNGLPVMKGMQEMFKNAMSSVARDLPTGIDGAGGIRKWAQDFGFGAEYALDRSMLSYDYMQSAGNTNTRFAAESVMQASGMNTWTHSARASFQYEFTMALSRMASSGELNPKTAQAMLRYGITNDDWIQLQNSPKTEYKGEMLLDPRKMEDELATKFVGMVDGEMGMAVPTPDARVRSQMTFGTKSGTPMGETTRGAFQFHSFNATLLMNNMTRLVAGTVGTNANRFGQLAAMMVGATVLGVAIVQARELMAGKTLMDWDDPKLIKRGFAQSGMGSYIGDFYSREAMGWGNSDALDFIGGAPAEYFQTMTAVMGAESWDEVNSIAANFATYEMPFQNLWYTKLATDRLLMDPIRRMADPKYDEKMKRRMRKMEKQTDQTYWWTPPTGDKK